jgi:nucleotide-binding universal stress UspA family protein
MAMQAITRPVLVGVDDTGAGAQALAWALREAAFRRAPVRVVKVWSRERHPAPPGSPPAGRARQAQETLVAQALAAFGTAGTAGAAAPEVSAELAEGDPASKLIEWSGSADLLVLGAGSGEADHARSTASVADVCTRYAGCPVVVVPTQGRRATVC